MNRYFLESDSESENQNNNSFFQNEILTNESEFIKKGYFIFGGYHRGGGGISECSSINLDDKGDSNSNEKIIEIKEKIFLIKKIDKERKKNELSIILHKKRGRARKLKILSNTNNTKNTNFNNKKIIIHDKSSKDNIIGKFQSGYLKFIIEFINQIIKEKFGITDIHFIPFAHLNTCRVNSKSKTEFKNSTLSYLLKTLQKSSKYKNYPVGHNEKIYEELCKRSILIKNFLDKTNYLIFFTSVYYRNFGDKRIVDLKKFGLDFQIEINKKIKIMQDLLGKSKNEKDFGNYEKNVDKYIKDYLGKFKVTKRKIKQKQRKEEKMFKHNSELLNQED